MSRLAWFFLWGVFLFTGALIAFIYGSQPLGTIDPLAFLVLIGLGIYGQFLEVKYGRDSYYPHFIPFFAALLLLPPLAFMAVVIIPHLVEWYRKRIEGNPYPWYIQPYNTATHIIAGLAAHWVFFRLGGTLVEFSLQSTLVALVPTMLVYAAINHFLIGQALLLARGLSWSDSGVLELNALVTECTMMSMGYIAAVLWTLTPWLLVLVVAPFAFFQRVFKLLQLEKQIQTDSKTGLWNARYFEQRLQEELLYAQKMNQPLAVIMGDLDLLRNINNSYGHLAGDAVIEGIAKIIMQTIRKVDVACRFGGEEYAILLPNVDQATASTVAERIRQMVESTPFHVVTTPEPIHATMSLGLACFPRDGQSISKLMHEADVALYQAKVQGRNLVVCTTEVAHLDNQLFEKAHEKERQPQSLAGTQAERPAAPEQETDSAQYIPVTPATSIVTGEPTPFSQPKVVWPTPIGIFVDGIIAAGILFVLFTLLFDSRAEPLPLIVFALLAAGGQWYQTQI